MCVKQGDLCAEIRQGGRLELGRHMRHSRRRSGAPAESLQTLASRSVIKQRTGVRASIVALKRRNGRGAKGGRKVDA